MQQVPGFRDLFASGQALDPAAGLTLHWGLLEWFRKHPLAPLTSRTAEAEEAPPHAAINGAITALQHDGGVTRFILDVRCGARGDDGGSGSEFFPTDRALLAATVERWTQAISAPLAPLIAGEGATVAYLHA